MEGVYYVNQIIEIDDDIFNEIYQLYKQLLTDANFTINDLKMMIKQDNILVGAFILYNKSLIYKTKLIGLATLHIEKRSLYDKPIGHIKDVIVHEEFRKIGMAKGMTEKLLKIAKKNNCLMVEINSNFEINKYFMSSFIRFQKLNKGIISEKENYLSILIN